MALPNATLVTDGFAVACGVDGFEPSPGTQKDSNASCRLMRT
jgi:hypothetical protein